MEFFGSICIAGGGRVNGANPLETYRLSILNFVARYQEMTQVIDPNVAAITPIQLKALVEMSARYAKQIHDPILSMFASCDTMDNATYMQLVNPFEDPVVATGEGSRPHFVPLSKDKYVSGNYAWRKDGGVLFEVTDVTRANSSLIQLLVLNNLLNTYANETPEEAAMALLSIIDMDLETAGGFSPSLNDEYADYFELSDNSVTPREKKIRSAGAKIMQNLQAMAGNPMYAHAMSDPGNLFFQMVDSIASRRLRFNGVNYTNPTDIAQVVIGLFGQAISLKNDDHSCVALIKRKQILGTITDNTLETATTLYEIGVASQIGSSNASTGFMAELSPLSGDMFRAMCSPDPDEARDAWQYSGLAAYCGVFNAFWADNTPDGCLKKAVVCYYLTGLIMGTGTRVRLSADPSAPSDMQMRDMIDAGEVYKLLLLTNGISPDVKSGGRNTFPINIARTLDIYRSHMPIKPSFLTVGQYAGFGMATPVVSYVIQQLDRLAIDMLSRFPGNTWMAEKVRRYFEKDSTVIAILINDMFDKYPYSRKFCEQQFPQEYPKAVQLVADVKSGKQSLPGQFANIDRNRVTGADVQLIAFMAKYIAKQTGSTLAGVMTPGMDQMSPEMMANLTTWIDKFLPQINPSTDILSLDLQRKMFPDEAVDIPVTGPMTLDEMGARAGQGQAFDALSVSALQQLNEALDERRKEIREQRNLGRRNNPNVFNMYFNQDGNMQ